MSKKIFSSDREYPEKTLDEKIIVSGSGGQGIMLMGKILSYSAACENRFVTWIPSYGAEMRGGTAHCFIRISEKEIASPVFARPTVLFLFNHPSYIKFKSKIRGCSLAIVNSSLLPEEEKEEHGKRVKYVPLSDMALEMGAPKAANMTGLGVYLKQREIVKKETVEKIIKDRFSGKQELIKINLEALKRGFSYD